MDRTELRKKLIPFVEKCKEKGRPVLDICLVEAYPGVVNSSFIVEVKTPWADGLSCSEALDFLFDVLWETTDVETRTKVFMIKIMSSDSEFHCASETPREIPTSVQ